MPRFTAWVATRQAAIPRALAFVLVAVSSCILRAQETAPRNLGDPVDVASEFQRTEPVYFMASRVASFDPASGRGTIQWDRYVRQPGLSFNKIDANFARAQATEFPGTEYDRDPVLPFAIDFISPRTVRLRFSSRDVPLDRMTDTASLMLAGPLPSDKSWQLSATDSAVTWTSRYGRVRLVKNPWSIQLYDSAGRLLTETQRLGQPASYWPYVPFSFVRRSRDLARNMAATFVLAPDEKIFGFGESFTRLDKRGQRIVAYLRDAMGAQSRLQYKAVPFFLSSRGYGMFVHTSAPVTFDVGADFDAHNTIYSGDELLDVFVFLGEPKDIDSEYTAITGRSPVPPLWSFGLWMSRITYKSEAEVRDVAAKLRQYRIPADVLHLDTGWFETDWRSDYKFSTTRFTDPAAMIRDLRAEGFRVSLWQYTYFTPKNPLWREIVDHGYEVRDEGGRLPSEDAVLDFSNPDAVAWYQAKLAVLLRMGVSVIKADFGEGAPLTGIYHSGRSGWYEHNLYPVRYNKAVYDVTKSVSGDGIIWGRSAWAGSQRYPLHWGGDAENTNQAMAAELRAGMSLGLSGFTYWSHDVGGFVNRAPRDLYRRWLAFGVLTSHTRTHGAPPREPWEYDSAFVDDFRRAVELKYRLMPYIYAQSVESSRRGWPLLRTLFFEYPADPGSWLVEDEYMFGSDLLVAPLFADSASSRQVYLPPGNWIDYQTGRGYRGTSWQTIAAGQIPIVLLVRNGAVIPHAAVAQSTSAIDWKHLELRVFSTGAATGSASVALPNDSVRTVRVTDGKVVTDPLRGRVTWQVTRADVAMVDRDATRETRALFINLRRLPARGFMFGHQNTLAYGHDWTNIPGRSDPKEATGSYPAVYGWDASTLFPRGAVDPGPLSHAAQLHAWIAEAYRRGGINTMSWHLDNIVTGNSFYDTTAAVAQILPGGAYHAAYVAKLDTLADFFNNLRAEGKDGHTTLVPVVFRPFHEMSGSWFWWGARHCSPSEYVSLYRFTVGYLRDVKHVHNLLYAFSPDVFDSPEEYLSRYPGDEWVDVLGYDDYQSVKNAETRATFERRLRMLVQLAESRGKVAALTETGLLNIPDSTWWTHVLLPGIEGDSVGRRIAWALVWRNADHNVEHDEQFFAPFPGQASAADFLAFRNAPSVLFEDELPNMYELPAQ